MQEEVTPMLDIFFLSMRMRWKLSLNVYVCERERFASGFPFLCIRLIL